jgi:hypothetical protein
MSYGQSRSQEELEAAALATEVDANAEVPQAVGLHANKLTGTTPYPKALAIQQYIHDRGLSVPLNAARTRRRRS